MSRGGFVRFTRSNSVKLICLEDEAIKLGWYKKHPKKCFSEYIAKITGEMGNMDPSDRAIEVAEEIVEKLRKKEFVFR